MLNWEFQKDPPVPFQGIFGCLEWLVPAPLWGPASSLVAPSSWDLAATRYKIRFISPNLSNLTGLPGCGMRKESAARSLVSFALGHWCAAWNCSLPHLLPFFWAPFIHKCSGLSLLSSTPVSSWSQPLPTSGPSLSRKGLVLAPPTP